MRGRRRVRSGVVAFVAAVLVGTLAASAVLAWGGGRVDRRFVAGLVGIDSAGASDAAPAARTVNVLVVGSDSREGLSRREIRELGTGRAEGNRSDTIMLAQLELNGRGRAAVLSFPRDLQVERCDGSLGRINAAYQVGERRDGDGPSCLVQTITELTGIPVNHYVEVSFAGFLRVVDAIGGVGLHLDEPLVDESAHLDLPAGCVRLRGADALGFVRARHVDNDFGRMARQQRFVKETLREAVQLGVVANPARLLPLVDAAASAVDTDDTLGLERMREIAVGLRGLSDRKLSLHTVPGTETTDGTGAWLVAADEAQAEALFAAFRDGSILDDPRGRRRRPPVVVPPFRVLNASGEAGVAGAAADLLARRGFTVAGLGNAEQRDAPRTRVVHAPDLAAAAHEVANALPRATLVSDESIAGITVEVGTDLRRSALEDLTATAPEQPARPTAPPTPAVSERPEYAGARLSDVDC